MTETLGFSRATFAFLRGLTENNEKAWFDAHRDDYERHVREPFAAALEAAADATVGGPWELHGGRETMFRINRDVRFAKDKSLYKTNVGAVMTRGGTKSDAGLLYVHVAHDDCFCWRPQLHQLSVGLA